MNRLLVVSKITPGTESRIGEIFAKSDATELPTITGTRHRSLYCLNDLFLHLVETDQTDPAAIATTHRHPLFVELAKGLSEHVSPYLATWRTPTDGMARCFYRWDAPVATLRTGQ